MRRIAFSLALLLFLTACATPRSQPFQEEARAEARLSADAFYAEDGAALPLRAWLPKGRSKAVVLALHGFNDYSNAFRLPGEYLKKRGIAVYAYDQRGFGASPMTGIWAGNDNLTRDARAALRLLNRRYPNTPLFLLGESMGGAVAILAASEEDFPRVDGLILVAPAVWGGDAMNPVYQGALWMVAHLTPDALFTGEDLRIHASDNIALLLAMGRDPLVIKATRADAVYGLAGLMGDAYARAEQVHTPALLLYGARDEVIPRAPVSYVAGHFGAKLDFRDYPDGYHMLLRDLERERVLKDIVEWVEGRK